MISLKEMYERLEELKSKERLYSEENAEMSDLIEKIALREKYLQRYINHPPHIVERVNVELEKLSPITYDKLSMDKVHTAISGVVNSMLALGQLFGRQDHDDLIFYIEKNVVVK
ncbi:hypothetical protein [Salmonella phage STP-4]